MLTFANIWEGMLQERMGNVMQTTTTVHWNKGDVARAHNEREEELCKNESHIDLYNEHGDSSHEVWYQSDLTEKYHELFGDAIENYNRKQKRKDRQIDVDGYMKSVEEDTRGKSQTKVVNGKKVVDENARKGKQLSYEVTAKVGNTDRVRDAMGRVVYDTDGHHIRKQELPRELQRKILKKYCDTFEEENPNLRLVNVNYHADEGFYNRQGIWEYSECHTHIEFIPVAGGFKQGLSIQNSMNKAMAEMGFADNQCYDKWAKKEQERLEKITQEEYQKYCQRHPDFYRKKGELEIVHPVTDKTKKGGKSKEVFMQEQELEEAIHEARYVKQVFVNGCNKNRSRENDLKAQKDDLKAQLDNLRIEQEKAIKMRNDALQMQRDLKAREKILSEERQVLEMERQRIRAEEQEKARTELKRRDAERQRQWKEYFEAVDKTMKKSGAQTYTNDSIRKAMQAGEQFS